MSGTLKSEKILARFFGSVSKARILGLLLSQAGRAFYQREIMFETGLSLHSTQRGLQNLQDLGIVKRRETVDKVYYENDSPLGSNLFVRSSSPRTNRMDPGRSKIWSKLTIQNCMRERGSPGGHSLGDKRLARVLLNFLVIAFIGILPIVASAGGGELRAFPGAEGFGAVSIGGRGGRVIKVTNLNSNGPGSLQAACETEGPRIVIFEVGGVIRGDVAIKHSHITIAGQTAPNPGITIEGRLLSRPEPWRRLNDIIMRFIRIRPPPITGHIGDAVQMPDTARVILDHLSMSWANDEMIDICHSSEFTVQWCTIEESDTEGHGKGSAHNFGIISAYPNSGNISIHHNLFAHHSRRVPSLSPYVPGKPGDFRNNVVYNFHEGLTHDGHTPLGPINFIANYYKRGPSSDRIFPFAFHKKGKYYLEGNLIDGFGVFNNPWDRRLKPPPWIQVNRNGKRLDKPADVASVTTHTAMQAYHKVLTRAGGFPRDRVTTRSIREVIEGTGRWGRNAPANPSDDWFLEGLVRGKGALDSDGDGIPDSWEDARGLNKRDPGDYNRIMPSGYTAIEDYINDRAEILIGAGNGLKP